MHIAIKFAYDGRKFHGFARQPQLKTIEGELLKSLIEFGFIEDIKESCFRSASRTDKGVSAIGNIIAFNTNAPKNRVFQDLKNNLTDIIIYGIKNVETEFYPRHAKFRIYRYYLKSNKLKIDEILNAAELFTGEHNFSNFAKIEEFKDPIRIIDNIIISKQDDFLIIDFYAQTFLWNQIRRIVSALEKVGKGKIEKKHIGREFIIRKRR